MTRPAAEEFEDDETDTVDGSDSALTLVFTAAGQCVLEENDEPVWMSDSDDDFQEEFGTEFLDADSDAAKILNWLVDEGWLDEDEKENVNVEVETNGDTFENETENEDEF